jgi:hypothetical protein
VQNNYQQISLAIVMKELYKLSNQFVYGSYCIQILLFLINLYFIFFRPRENNIQIWFLLPFSIGMIIISVILVYKSKKYYEIGESIRKIDIIRKIFPKASDTLGISYLISNISISIIKKAQNNPEEQTIYYTNKKNKYEKLIEYIQQNCYFTSELMRIYANKLLIVIISISILFVISIIYSFYYILSEKDINQELSKSIASYLSLFVNFVLTLNIIEHYILFDKKAKDLKKLDEKLNSLKNNPHEDEIITSFTEYNCVLCDALPYPEFIYNREQAKLNSFWENRINNT